MQEREQRSDDLSKREMRVILAFSLFFLALSGSFVPSAMEQIKQTDKLRARCIAEQVIDEKGNPGRNFNFETEESQLCDTFTPSKYLPGRRRFEGSDRRNYYSAMLW